LALGGFPTPLLAYFLVTPFADGWRYMLALLGLPVFLLLWWRRKLPESPRWLIEQGRHGEAEAVVADLERRVEQPPGDPLPALTGDIHPPMALQHESRAVASWLTRLWTGGLVRVTAVVWIAIFAIQFCNWGFASWAPSLLVREGVKIDQSLLFAAIVQ